MPTIPPDALASLESIDQVHLWSTYWVKARGYRHRAVLAVALGRSRVSIAFWIHAGQTMRIQSVPATALRTVLTPAEMRAAVATPAPTKDQFERQLQGVR